MRRAVPARSRLQEGLITRRGHLVSRTWGDLKPLLASVRSPHTLGEATGVCVRSPFRVPPARTGSRSRVGFGEAVDTGRRRRQVARSAPPPRPGPAPRPAPPPARRAPGPGLAAAATAPGSGGGGRARGHGGGRRGRRGSRGLELPRSEPPLPPLSTAAPSSSPSFQPADPQVFPPSAAPTFRS